LLEGSILVGVALVSIRGPEFSIDSGQRAPPGCTHATGPSKGIVPLQNLPRMFSKSIGRNRTDASRPFCSYCSWLQRFGSLQDSLSTKSLSVVLCTKLWNASPTRISGPAVTAESPLCSCAWRQMTSFSSMKNATIPTSTVLDMAMAGRIGFSKFVSLGNKADVGEVDLLTPLRSYTRHRNGEVAG